MKNIPNLKKSSSFLRRFNQNILKALIPPVANYFIFLGVLYILFYFFKILVGDVAKK